MSFSQPIRHPTGASAFLLSRDSAFSYNPAPGTVGHRSLVRPVALNRRGPTVVSPAIAPHAETADLARSAALSFNRPRPEQLPMSRNGEEESHTPHPHSCQPAALISVGRPFLTNTGGEFGVWELRLDSDHSTAEKLSLIRNY